MRDRCNLAIRDRAQCARVQFEHSSTPPTGILPALQRFALTRNPSGYVPAKQLFAERMHWNIPTHATGATVRVGKVTEASSGKADIADGPQTTGRRSQNWYRCGLGVFALLANSATFRHFNDGNFTSLVAMTTSRNTRRWLRADTSHSGDTASRTDNRRTRKEGTTTR